jgi:hypothetical protein
MTFKERAIYQLPNGRQLVACMTCGDETVLYTLSTSESRRYELNSQGRLLFDGRLTAWGIGDLLETGRVATPEVACQLLERSKTDGEVSNDRRA